MGLKICMGNEHHWYYKHTKFRQNPRSDFTILVDLTWNDPFAICISPDPYFSCKGASGTKLIDAQKGQLLPSHC